MLSDNHRQELRLRVGNFLLSDTSPQPPEASPVVLRRDSRDPCDEIQMSADAQLQEEVGEARSSGRSARGRVKNARTLWTHVMERALLNGLVEARKQSLDTLNWNFRAAGWSIAVSLVQQSTDQPMTREICDNRWRKIRTIWRLWERHKKQVADWTWNSHIETYVHNVEVTRDYFDRHPDLQIFRAHGPAHMDLLEKLMYGNPTSEDHDESRVEISNGDKERLEPVEPENPTPSPALPAITKPLYQPDPIAPTGIPAPPMVISQVANQIPPPIPTPTDDRFQAESRLVNALITYGNILVETSRGISTSMVSPFQTACTEFVKEADQLLPLSWRNETGRVPYSRYSVILKALRDPLVSQTYISLRHCPIEDRREWIMDVLRDRDAN
ncbi:hypothetical protein LOZ53_002408 [Ophidiomyces ophidiicola]|nr:hypothetical protein LOZ55_004855 [Ophidiomyces ophidiicola]KAI1986668.1 hypothetical protein LOZ54_003789 [Ophidiomyces ophidiicola]KAI1992608.1 hypothetical protein LOZ53_002408 [Ophidiomyces ophidiicola]KAI1999174.1 hypothetical protein LOZ51_001660 [Ophidiomyces ophidiicola]